jgi:hypothetical protein
MTTPLRQGHEETEGDPIAYSIAVAGDIVIAGGENCDTAAAPAKAYAVLQGEVVQFTGKLTFTGANTSLDFTLPADLKPYQNEVLPLVINDGGVFELGLLTVTASSGVAAITQADAAAWAAADYVVLSGSYIRG